MDLPPGRKAMNTKFIFKIKRKTDGSLDRFKARLVFQNYRRALQPYDEGVYSPVVNKATVRLFLAIAATERMQLEQLDVIAAFLNVDVAREVYIKMPQGFTSGTGKVREILSRSATYIGREDQEDGADLAHRTKYVASAIGPNQMSSFGYRRR